MYYEDRQTGSIFSIRELVEAARREQIPLEELSKGFNSLPYRTALLIEEAETIAANAEEERERPKFDSLF